jgi:hypothetical protein
MVMQPDTGQTRWQRLQPMHSASSTMGTVAPGTPLPATTGRNGPRGGAWPVAGACAPGMWIHWWAPSWQAT